MLMKKTIEEYEKKGKKAIYVITLVMMKKKRLEKMTKKKDKQMFTNFR